MPYKFSRCFAMEHPQSEELIAFYHEKIGLTLVHSDSEQVEFDAAPVRLFVDKSEKQTLIFELLVPDLEAARKDLVAKGCQIIRWEGKGKTCYVRDPFGFVFNVWEEPDAFET
jgi:catechol 2,3-dioxygenase-like lactoylglutathione lyase family enzyme